MDDRSDERHDLVERTIARRGVTDPRVLAAMRAVPRHHFLPADRQAEAYLDEPVEIGFGATISQPYVVAWMAELAGVAPGMRVLDVGTGSGYQAAVLAAIGAEVWSVEIVPELLERARALLPPSVHLRLGDGRLGWPEAAPFDAILVAAATRNVPDPLLDQLAPNGRLVIPLGTPDLQELVVLERTEWGGFRRRGLGAVAFVPLV